MSDKPANTASGNRALGISFLVLGMCTCVVFGLTFGPAFIGIGLPFAALGVIFLPKSGEGQQNEGDQ